MFGTVVHFSSNAPKKEELYSERKKKPQGNCGRVGHILSFNLNVIYADTQTRQHTEQQQQ